LHGLSGPLGLKWDFWAGERGVNGGRGGAMLTPTNSFLLLGVFTSVPIFVKIDRPRECPCTDDYTLHIIYTHGHTQTGFVICHMLYAIAMGQIINEIHKI